MAQSHRWNTEEFEKRTKELYRVELHKLYPSEAWALYRVMPQCKTVLDLGCGNGAMGNIVRQISPDTQYTGMDHQGKLMKKASDIFPFAKYSAGDLLPYLESCAQFDAVMAWSVIKSFQNWRGIVADMIQKANKYVMVDIRVANVESEIWDEKICWAQYGDRKGPMAVPNYRAFKQALLEHSDVLERIEILSYQSVFGKQVHFKGIEPKQFIVVCVLKKKQGADDNAKACDVYEQLPGNLRRD